MSEEDGLSVKIDKMIHRYEALITRLNEEIITQNEIISDLRGERRNALAI